MTYFAITVGKNIEQFKVFKLKLLIQLNKNYFRKANILWLGG